MSKNNPGWTSAEEIAVSFMLFAWMRKEAALRTVEGGDALPAYQLVSEDTRVAVIENIKALCGLEETDPRFLPFFRLHIEQFGKLTGLKRGRFGVVGTGQAHFGQTAEIRGTLAKLFRTEKSRAIAEKVCEKLAPKFPGVAFEVFPRIPAVRRRDCAHRNRLIQ